MKILLNRRVWHVLVVLMFVAGTFGLRAQEQGVNKLYISDFNITSTAPQEVAIELENTPELAALQFKVILPQGVNILEVRRNADRLSPGQNISFAPKRDNLFMVTSGSRNTFNGTEGVLVWITVQADKQVVDNGMAGEIKLTDIIYSSAAGQPLPGSKTSTTQITVQPGSGVLGATPGEIVMNPSQSRNIEVSLTNDFNVQGLQMDITLPEGFTIAGNVVNLTGRLSNGANATITPRADGRTYGLVIVDYNGNNIINTGEGAIFNFDLVAPYDFSAENVSVKFSNFQMSNRDNKTIIGTGCDIKIINGKVVYDNAYNRIEALQQKLNDVLTSINNECPLVAENFKGTELQERIDALKEAVDNAYESMTLTPDYENIMAPASAIESDIDAYLVAAKNAQAAEEKRRADNKTAYDAVLAEIAVLQAQFDAAKAEIAEKYAAFRDEQAETALQATLDAAKTQAEEVYNSVANEGVFTYTVDSAAIEAQIKALVNDAKARAEEAGRQTANKAAYDADMDRIATLQAQLDAAKAEIAEKYAAYASVEEEATAQKAVDDLKAAVEAAYAAVAKEGVYGYKLDTASAEALIQALVPAAQARADEAARQAANKAAYEADLAIIANLQAQLDAAKAEAREKYNCFVDTSSEDYIQTQLDIMKLGVNNAYTAVAASGIYNYTLDTSNIEARIAALVPAAAEVFRQDCNAKAYDADLALLDKLMDEFDVALDTIRTLYPTYIDSDYVTSMRAQLNAAREACDKEYAAVEDEGLYKSQVNYDSLSLAIKQLVETIKTVGIDSIILNDVDLTDAAIYTVDGQRHSAPVKGQMNIIRLSDGSVMKVMVK